MIGRAGACLLAAHVLIAEAGCEQQPFRSAVDGVRVDVLVTDRGRPVRGLTVDDFEVLDNGVPQQVRLVASDQSISAVILLDVSHSVVGYAQLSGLREAARHITGALRPGDRVGLLTFARGARLVVAPTGEFSSIDAALTKVLATTPRRRTESTALWDAVFAAAAIAADLGGRPLVILLSDGGENSSWLARNQPSDANWIRDARAKTVDALRGSGVVVDVVVSPYRNVSEVEGDDVYGPIEPGAAADAVGGAVFAVADRRLKQNLENRLAALRAGYVLAFTPQRLQHDGTWHTLTVRLKGKPGKVHARSGYFAPQAPR